MTIKSIRKFINDNIGNNVSIECNEGRNKVYTCKGVIKEVYSNIFIVKDENYNRSFSYYDILTNSIIIKIIR